MLFDFRSRFDQESKSIVVHEGQNRGGHRVQVPEVEGREGNAGG
jgi:hypothetical protein